MLNVSIQNDGKIKIQMECSDVKEIRSNVVLLSAIVSSMKIDEKAVNKDASNSKSNNYYLYLNFVPDDQKFSTIRELKQQLDIPLKDAKDAVDSAAKGKRVPILEAFNNNLVENIKKILESKGCICEITKG